MRASILFPPSGSEKKQRRKLRMVTKNIICSSYKTHRFLASRRFRKIDGEITLLLGETRKRLHRLARFAIGHDSDSRRARIIARIKANVVRFGAKRFSPLILLSSVCRPVFSHNSLHPEHSKTVSLFISPALREQKQGDFHLVQGCTNLYATRLCLSSTAGRMRKEKADLRTRTVRTRTYSQFLRDVSADCTRLVSVISESAFCESQLSSCANVARRTGLSEERCRRCEETCVWTFTISCCWHTDPVK